MMIKEISVFFPCYNEEDNITQTVERAVATLRKLKIPKWEIIVVNDGSTDKTEEVAKKLANKYSHVKVVSQLNGGYGMALRAGFRESRYSYIVYTDADGQFDFNELPKFLEKIDKYDLLIGYRIKRSDPLIRLINAKGWALALWLFFGLRLRDVDCGFKMVKKEVIEKIGELESTRGGMINAELAIKAKRAGFKVSEVGVHHFPRLAGKPTGANIRVIIRSFVDLFKLWWKMKKIKF